MHVLMVRSTLVDMGPGTQPLVLANELRRRGVKVSFATSGGVMAPEVEKQGFSVHLIPSLAPDRHNPSDVVKAVLGLRRLIVRERVDVIHGHNAAATLCAWTGGVLAGRFLPAATSVRGVEERTTHQYRNFIWRCLPGTVLAVCENGRERLLKYGVRSNRIVVTYNGVDLQKFDPTAFDGEAERAKLGLTGCIVIATVGAMVGSEGANGPTKGQHILVKAFARIHARHPTLRVMLVGDGPLREVAERAARELGVADKVLFLGRRFDVSRLLSATDIYCLPSIWGEFFPNSILEAMAMGKPWVGTDIAGLSELTASGEAGITVPIGDDAALAEKLDLLVSNEALRRRMGARARREVETRFAIDQVTSRVIAGYAAAGAGIRT